MRLTITGKIILGVTLILLIGGATMATIFIALNAIERSLHEVSEVEEPTSAAAYEMEISVVNMGLGTVNYVNTGAPRSRQIVEKSRADFERFKAQYDRLAETDRGKELGDRIAVLFQEYAALVEDLISRRDRGEAALFATNEYQRFLDLRFALHDLLNGDIQSLTRADLNASVREADEAQARAFRLSMVLVPIFILFSVGAALLMARAISNPVRKLMLATEAIGKGEFDYRIPDRGGDDELAELVQRFNRMAAHLSATTVAKDQLDTQVQERTSELAQSNLELNRSNRELQDFAFVASHDLQEPLRKIQAFGDRLKTKYGATLKEEGRDYLERMQSAASRMHNLINDLLAFSRVTTAAQPFVPTDLGEVTREVLDDLETRIEQTGGRVELGQLPVIEADPLQMRQLLQNLAANGLKFHRAEEAPIVKIHGRLVKGGEAHAQDSSSNGLCEIIVEDNGIGFDEKYLDRIFTPFQRLHARGAYEGTGMGLAVCRKIVERHGGSITAKSLPGQGTTFFVTLPIKQTQGENKQ